MITYVIAKPCAFRGRGDLKKQARINPAGYVQLSNPHRDTRRYRQITMRAISARVPYLFNHPRLLDQRNLFRKDLTAQFCSNKIDTTGQMIRAERNLVRSSLIAPVC